VRRHTLELASRGYQVTGVDFNEEALAAAREGMGRRGVAAELVQADMRRFTSREPFDTAFCWFGSFGYFPEEENLEFLRAVARALLPAPAS
jgi:SAM-dependent methyltransferase